jgi:hypothetical protein
VDAFRHGVEGSSGTIACANPANPARRLSNRDADFLPSGDLMETFTTRGADTRDGGTGVGLLAAPIIGPTVGGYITDNWNWRWNFYINVPLGMFAAFMVSTFVNDPP